jgi:hypothetical protein
MYLLFNNFDAKIAISNEMRIFIAVNSNCF